jgi:hypothetical protein
MIITEHEQTTNVDKTHHEDFVDILLSIKHQTIGPKNEQKHVIDRPNIKAILLDMVIWQQLKHLLPRLNGLYLNF